MWWLGGIGLDQLLNHILVPVAVSCSFFAELPRSSVRESGYCHCGHPLDHAEHGRVTSLVLLSHLMTLGAIHGAKDRQLVVSLIFYSSGNVCRDVANIW